MITHANLMANVEALDESFRAGSDDVVVSWLPLFHDMGLMLGAIWPIVSGASVVLMRPSSFIANPVLWLRTISRYAATVSSGPNFGYQLCLDRVADEELPWSRLVVVADCHLRRRTGAARDDALV